MKNDYMKHLFKSFDADLIGMRTCEILKSYSYNMKY